MRETNTIQQEFFIKCCEIGKIEYQKQLQMEAFDKKLVELHIECRALDQEFADAKAEEDKSKVATDESLINQVKDFRDSQEDGVMPQTQINELAEAARGV